MQKGFSALILLFMVVIIGVGAGYFLFISKTSNNSKATIESSSSPESQINIYTNKDLAIEFKFPKDFKVKEDSEEEFDNRGKGDFRKNFIGYIGYEPPKFVTALSVVDKSNNIDASPFTLWVFENPDNLSHEVWYKKYWYYPFVWGDFTSRADAYGPLKDTQVDGREGKYGIITYRPNNPKFIHVAKGGKMFLFKIVNIPEGIADQILQSFKFSVQADETANWKTYKAKDYLIKIPSNFIVEADSRYNRDYIADRTTQKDGSVSSTESITIFRASIADQNPCQIDTQKESYVPPDKSDRCMNTTFYKAYEFGTNTKIGPQQYWYYLIDKNTLYTIVFTDIDSEKKDRILNSFKFL